MQVNASVGAAADAARMLDEPDRSHAVTAVRALAGLAIVTLTAMVAITAATGVSQEQFEIWRGDYADAIVAAHGPLRAIIAIDAVFLIAYAAFFILLPRALGVAVDGLIRLGVGALLAVAVLDMIEDHHLLALARSAAAGAAIDDATIRAQHVLSQVKFHLSYLGLALFALGLPRDHVRVRAFAWALGVPLPVLGAVLWGIPALEPVLYAGRWLAFLGGFVGALAIVRRR